MGGKVLRFGEGGGNREGREEGREGDGKGTVREGG